MSDNAALTVHFFALAIAYTLVPNRARYVTH
jgi:hypothetical protein